MKATEYFMKSMDKMYNITDAEKYRYVIDIIDDLQSFTQMAKKDEDYDNKLGGGLEVCKVYITYLYKLYSKSNEEYIYDAYRTAWSLIMTHDNMVSEFNRSDEDIAKDLDISLEDYRKMLNIAHDIIRNYQEHVCRDYITGKRYDFIQDVAARLYISDDEAMKLVEEIKKKG